MPLVRSVLEDGLYQAFSQVERTEPPIATRWGDALEAYLGPIVPPSSQVATACATFRSAWRGFSAADQFRPTLSAQLVSMAATVAGGMVAPPGVTVATPPASPPTFPTEKFIDARQAAVRWSTAIDAWFKTGTATVGGSPAIWS